MAACFLEDEISVYSRDITPATAYSKHQEFRKMIFDILGAKCFKEMGFKTFKNRKQWFRETPAITKGVKSSAYFYLEESCTFQTITVVAHEVTKGQVKVPDDFPFS